MEKTNEKSESKVVCLCELIMNKIITEMSRVAAPDITAFKVATDKSDEVLALRASYTKQLDEKKAVLKKEKAINTGSSTDIKTSLEKRRRLEAEARDIELSIIELTEQFLPGAEAAIKEAREKIYKELYPTIVKTKKEYETQLEALFLEAGNIMAAFEKALFLLSDKPEFLDLTGVLVSLREFDLACPFAFEPGTICSRAMKANLHPAI